MPKHCHRDERCRAVSVSLRPEDEDFLRESYPGTFSDAVRSAILDAKAYHASIGRAPSVREDARDV